MPSLPPCASEQPPQGRWTQGPSVDGRGKFKIAAQPGAPMPPLGLARPTAGAQMEQIKG